MSLSQDSEPAGLRERKKAKTRAAIQDHALRLFVVQGYTETTIKQIAEAAEVSQSTFFRYFPTKEDTVLYDRLAPQLIEAFLDQPAELAPLAALRGALHQVFDRLQDADSDLERVRQWLVFTQPELRGMMVDLLGDSLTRMANVVAARVGREPDDPAARTFCGAALGVVLSAFLVPKDQGLDTFIERFDAELTLLERGLPL